MNYCETQAKGGAGAIVVISYTSAKTECPLVPLAADLDRVERAFPRETPPGRANQAKLESLMPSGQRRLDGRRRRR